MVILCRNVLAGRCANNGLRFPTSRSDIKGITFCKPWKNNTCCNAQTDKLIHRSGQVEVDGTKWDLCGKLSKQCEKYFKYETCFYECSPDLEKYISPWRNMERYKGVPTCATSCDQWYNACKHDMVCAKNWNKDFKWRRTGNECRKGYPCKSFEEMYGSGKSLCNNIWSNTLVYTEDCSDCLKLWPE